MQKIWKYLVVCKVFRTVSWFSWFFRIINVYQCFFTLDILFDRVNRGLGNEKILLDKIYIIFWKKLFKDDLN